MRYFRRYDLFLMTTQRGIGYIADKLFGHSFFYSKINTCGCYDQQHKGNKNDN